MGISLHVVGLRDENDPNHVKMVKAKEALDTAGVKWPKEIYDYFDGSSDSDTPLEVKLQTIDWRNDYYSGYEIDVDTLPKNIKKIRVSLG